MKMHVDYDWSVRKLKETPDDEQFSIGHLYRPKCAIAGCPHESTEISNYCIFHETPGDRERAALRRGM